MSYSTDKSITSEKEDVLGRKDFSKRLGRLIYNYQGEDGLVLGLYGEWGSGKTSVINMVEEEINRLAEKTREEARKKAEEGKVQTPSEGGRKEDENDPLIIRFSPWYYSDNDNLISLFFQSLKNKIDKNEALKERIGKTLNDYVSAFEVLSVVPIPGSKAVAKFIQQQIKASYEKKADLDSIKKALEKALKEVKKKIVIVIDDIDRLTNTQIRDIFQLVKSVGDLPYIIYILAMDREIVARALTEVHQTDGSRYLEKIIQMPVELPKLSKAELNVILSKKIDEIVDKFPDKIVGDKWYRIEVLTNCVYPYITTLRDINRLINIFQFRYGMLYEETSFEDMLGITTLAVFEPKLYRWIYNNKNAVCGGMNDLLSDDDTNPDYRQFYSDEFTNMGINSGKAIQCITTMFPEFAYKLNQNNYGFQSSLTLRNKMRVANEKIFERYFVFNLGTIKVSRSRINACLFEYDKNLLSKMISEASKSGDTVYLLEGIVASIDEIPYERLDIIASIVFDLQMEFKVTDKRSQEYIEEICDLTSELMHKIIKKKFEKEKEKGAYKFIQDMLNNIGKFGLGVMASIMEWQEYEHDRIRDPEVPPYNEATSINSDQLDELEKRYVEKVRTVVECETILELYQFQKVFDLWYFLDTEGAKAYAQNSFKDEMKALKFICRMATKNTDSKYSTGWVFPSNRFFSCISNEKCYRTIQGFDKRKLDEFTKTEQIQLASFFIIADKSRLEENEPDATKTEVEKLLNEWKTAQ